jgi:hypothetical protein
MKEPVTYPSMYENAITKARRATGAPYLLKDTQTRHRGDLFLLPQQFEEGAIGKLIACH